MEATSSPRQPSSAPEGAGETVDRAGTDPARLGARLAALDLPAKIGLLTGRDFWSLPAQPAAGLASILTSDGPNGVRGPRWDERDTGLLLPNPTALAASWDTGLLHRVGEIFGQEARRRGVRVLLAPTINLQRSPLGGRHFENFSEDPLLTGELAAAYVHGVQSVGVAATAKHFVGNESETARLTYDAAISERALREVYLRPFEILVRRTGVWAVMAAYNGVNGSRMTEHQELLTGILKGEWGFDGVVVSDWIAARSTVPSALAGLDLVMPGPGGPWGAALLAAVRAGEVPAALIDDKVRRLLLLAARTGALTDLAESPASVDASGRAPAEMGPEIRALTARTMVLLRNEPMADGRTLLPIDPTRLRRIALIGENALRPTVQGGGSAHVFPPYAVSPAAGLRRALPARVELVVARGVRHHRLLDPIPPSAVRDPASGAAGFRVEYRSGDGRTLAVETRAASRLRWVGGQGLPTGTERVVMTGLLTVETAGEHAFAVDGIGAVRVELAGERVFEAVLEGDGDDFFTGLIEPPQRRFTAAIAAVGRPVELVVTKDVDPRDVFTVVGLGHGEPGWDDDEALAEAVREAGAADLAIVVVGTNDEVEAEGRDRTGLALPGRQDELVRAVREANPATVVVVNAGAPVLLPWAESSSTVDSSGSGRVSAVLWSWFGGQEYGAALADILLGTAEPTGRLPTTFPAAVDATTVLPVEPIDNRLPYAEGTRFGYRRYAAEGVRPAFPFGHGIGYTDWEYADAPILESDVDGSTLVRVAVRNVGDRPGGEVVQVYARTPDAEPARLVGFSVVHAAPGTTVETSIEIEGRALAGFDTERGWVIPAGRHHLAIGRSERDIRAEATIEFGADVVLESVR